MENNAKCPLANNTGSITAIRSSLDFVLTHVLYGFRALKGDPLKITLSVSNIFWLFFCPSKSFKGHFVSFWSTFAIYNIDTVDVIEDIDDVDNVDDIDDFDNVETVGDIDDVDDVDDIDDADDVI